MAEIHAGTLTKLGWVRTNWKQRLFVLSVAGGAAKLRYYENEHGKVLGELELHPLSYVERWDKFDHGMALYVAHALRRALGTGVPRIRAGAAAGNATAARSEAAPASRTRPLVA